MYYFLGSSVTRGEATGGVSFVEDLANDNGWDCRKEAVSGTTLVDNGDSSYVQRMKNNIDPDLAIDHFICQLSTNDASQNKPMGTVSDSTNMEDFDTSTIIGAMEYIIAYARETWNCPVSFYTNPHYNNALYQSMVEALYDLQEKWDIGIIDFYNYRDMEPLSDATLRSYMADDIHPNAHGYQWMADVMTDYFNGTMGSGDEETGRPAVANEAGYQIGDQVLHIGYDSEADKVVEIYRVNDVGTINPQDGTNVTRGENNEYMNVPKETSGRAFWNFTYSGTAGTTILNDGIVTAYKIMVNEDDLAAASDDTILFTTDNTYYWVDADGAEHDLGIGIPFTKADYMKAVEGEDGYRTFVTKVTKDTMVQLGMPAEYDIFKVQGRMAGNGNAAFQVDGEMIHYLVTEDGKSLYDVQNPDSLAIVSEEPGDGDNTSSGEDVSSEEPGDGDNTSSGEDVSSEEPGDGDNTSSDEDVSSEEPADPADPGDNNDNDNNGGNTNTGNGNNNNAGGDDNTGDSNTDGTNPVTGALPIAGAAVLAAAAAAAVVVSKKRK